MDKIPQNVDEAIAEIEAASAIDLLQVLVEAYERQRESNHDAIIYHSSVLGITDVHDKLQRLKDAEDERTERLIEEVIEQMQAGTIK